MIKERIKSIFFITITLYFCSIVFLGCSSGGDNITLNSTTYIPTSTPSETPTYSPSESPSVYPSMSPSVSPSPNPTNTISPTSSPSVNPTPNPLPTKIEYLWQVNSALNEPSHMAAYPSNDTKGSESIIASNTGSTNLVKFSLADGSLEELMTCGQKTSGICINSDNTMLVSSATTKEVFYKKITDSTWIAINITNETTGEITLQAVYSKSDIDGVYVLLAVVPPDEEDRTNNKDFIPGYQIVQYDMDGNKMKAWPVKSDETNPRNFIVGTSWLGIVFREGNVVKFYDNDGGSLGNDININLPYDMCIFENMIFILYLNNTQNKIAVYDSLNHTETIRTYTLPVGTSEGKIQNANSILVLRYNNEIVVLIGSFSQNKINAYKLTN